MTIPVTHVTHGARIPCNSPCESTNLCTINESINNGMLDAILHLYPPPIPPSPKVVAFSSGGGGFDGWGGGGGGERAFFSSGDQLARRNFII